jgi:hypothetical protein
MGVGSARCLHEGACNDDMRRVRYLVKDSTSGDSRAIETRRGT